MCKGRSFHILGATAVKVCSPHSVRVVLSTLKSSLSDENRWVQKNAGAQRAGEGQDQ